MDEIRPVAGSADDQIPAIYPVRKAPETLLALGFCGNLGKFIVLGCTQRLQTTG